MKTKKDSKTVTITALSDESTIDRRTIKRYATLEGLEPVRRYRGAAYYDRSDLIQALAKHHKAKQFRVQSGPLDAVAWLKEIFDDLATAQLRLRIVDLAPEKFTNVPANHADIQAIVRGELLRAVGRVGDLIGRGED